MIIFVNLVDPHPIRMPIQEAVTVTGMILMEGAKGVDGVFLLKDEQEVKLDIDQVDQYAIFPGMICALEGNNPTGDLFVVTKIIPQEIEPIPNEGRVIEDTSE